MNKTILVVAYACEPDKGSEPGVGWNWIKQISKENNTIIITRNNNRKSIENGLIQDEKLKERTYFYYYDPPHSLTFWKKGSKGLQLYYLIWQRGVLCYAKKIAKKHNIDYVFLPTFGNLWKPTFLYRLPYKFIWGPVGGGECVPKQLISHLTKKQQIMEWVRRINFHIPLSNPWFYRVCKKSYKIIVRTRDSLMCIPEKYRDKCQVMIETGVEETDCNRYSKEAISPEKSEDILIVGRLISLKFVDIGIKAFQEVQNQFPCAKLHILGDGNCRDRLEKLALEKGVSDKVIFHGNVPREEVLRRLASARALLMTSSKEGGAWVLFEAMMCQRPIICMDTAGMHTIVPDDGGIKIKVSSYDEMVENFAVAIKDILSDGDKANQLGMNGYKYVSSELLWHSKRMFFEKILED